MMLRNLLYSLSTCSFFAISVTALADENCLPTDPPYLCLQKGMDQVQHALAEFTADRADKAALLDRIASLESEINAAIHEITTLKADIQSTHEATLTLTSSISNLQSNLDKRGIKSFTWIHSRNVYEKWPDKDKCIFLEEPADPHTWEDNYLCFTR